MIFSPSIIEANMGFYLILVGGINYSHLLSTILSQYVFVIGHNFPLQVGVELFYQGDHSAHTNMHAEE